MAQRMNAVRAVKPKLNPHPQARSSHGRTKRVRRDLEALEDRILEDLNNLVDFANGLLIHHQLRIGGLLSKKPCVRARSRAKRSRPATS
jgi:hypothetical protein